jgi:hypothetical protein
VEAKHVLVKQATCRRSRRSPQAVDVLLDVE